MSETSVKLIAELEAELPEEVLTPEDVALLESLYVPTRGNVGKKVLRMLSVANGKIEAADVQRRATVSAMVAERQDVERQLAEAVERADLAEIREREMRVIQERDSTRCDVLAARCGVLATRVAKAATAFEEFKKQGLCLAYEAHEALAALKSK